MSTDSENKKIEKSQAAKREEAVLAFWKENKIFEKSLEKENPNGEFVFYDGPATANGKPGIHHLEARAFKDAIPRYKTMQGFHVRRKAGWDTHGLPVELQVEKQLGFKSKKDIENYGVEKFNEACKASVWTYIDEWEKFTDRIGFWVDTKNPYKTYDASYIQSLWNIVKKVDDQNLLYKDYKVVPFCPRDETALASHELAQGYQDDTDLSVVAKFPLKGFPNAYFLAWTTTPWTLPGNVALAVGNDIDYVEAKVAKENYSEILVLAKDLLSIITEPYEIIAEHKGSEMVGMEYEPLYPYLADLDKNDEKLKNAFKIYAADFVTTNDGTGIVHIAPMYGQDDFELATKYNLPKVHLVLPNGHFLPSLDFLANRFVKDEQVAVDIIKDLANRKPNSLLFKKEKYTHSYPHCWRCKTPLIYYARDSWYIGMSTLRDTLIENNKNIHWEPNHVKEGRFGEWIRDVKDWAISRERYWGTPLPIWVAEDGEKIVVDSFETLKKYTKKSGNNYFVMRHGESEHNTAKIFNSDKTKEFHLTEEGKKQVKASAEKLKDKKITAIYASPFLRAMETAQIVAEIIGIPQDKIIVDDRFGELQVGNLDGQNFDDFFKFVEKDIVSLDTRFPAGESFQDAKNRVGDALYEIDAQYKNESILVVGHGITIEGITLIVKHDHEKDGLQFVKTATFPKGGFEEFELPVFPHNKNYELDPHRPFIDEIILEKEVPASAGSSGMAKKEFRRVKEVMDVWFDSGAMPFAQDGYPFDSAQGKPMLYYPADFIAEGMDQTRGWFYTLHAVGALMGKGNAFNNVICLGLILDKDGKKMSKSVGNVVDPWMMMEKYGADTLRLWMYSINQPGDSKNFDEKTVHELSGKVFALLYNVMSFYELYRDKELEKNAHSTSSGQLSSNVLDSWILAKLNQLTETVTENLDNYKLLEPVRAIREFIDDLSTWYLRRSRDRIKSSSAKGFGGTKNGDDAKKTLYIVLKNLSKLLAPFAPFTAEDLWLKLKTESDLESVHLEKWAASGSLSSAGEGGGEVLAEMQLVRDLCAVGNALRKKAGIPVRQPLAVFFVTEDLENEYKIIMQEELNVKQIEKGAVIIFDERITPELKLEGEYRELVREIQDLRKEKGLTPSDVITLTLANQYQEIVSKFGDELKKIVMAKEIIVAEMEEKISIE